MNYQDMIKKKKSTSQGEGVGSEGKDSDVSQGNDKTKPTIIGKIANKYRDM
jgi:hypothetical protein